MEISGGRNPPVIFSFMVVFLIFSISCLVVSRITGDKVLTNNKTDLTLESVGMNPFSDIKSLMYSISLVLNYDQNLLRMNMVHRICHLFL